MAKQPSFVDVFKEFLGADWFDTQKFPTPSPQAGSSKDTRLAQYLLTHSKPGPTLVSDDFKVAGAATEEPSFLNKTIDFLDQVTGSRIARNTADAIATQDKDAGFFENLGDEVQSIGKAVAGGAIGLANDTLLKPLNLIDKIPGVDSPAADMRNQIDELSDKWNPDVRGSSTLDKTGVENKWAKGIGGFALEVALDPSWLIPGLGFAKSGAKAATADATITAKAAGSPQAFVKPMAPDISVPPAIQAMRGGSAPGQFGNFAPGKVDLPVAPGPNLNLESPMDQYSVAHGILNDPDSLAEMKKAKKSDDGWRAAQVRWKRDPDVEQSYLDSAVSKAAWYEEKTAQRLAKQGKVTDGKGDYSQITVARILKNIEEGSIPRWGAEPVAAEGFAKTVAVKAANDQVEAMIAKGTRLDLNPANQANLYDRMFKETEQVFKSDPELVAKYTTTTAPKLTPKNQKIANEIEANGADNVLDAVDSLAAAKTITPRDASSLKKYFTGKTTHVNVNSPRALTARRVMARAMLKSAEDHLISAGKIPEYWDGTRVRLSDVLEEIGLEANDELATTVMNAWKTKDLSKVKEPAVAEAIYRALARRPLHLSSLLESVGERAKHMNASILDNYTPVAAAKAQVEMINHAAEIGKRAGLTSDESDALKKIVAGIVDAEKIAPEKLLAVLGPKLNEAVMEGRASADVLHKVGKEISKTLGQTKKELMTNVTGHKVVDGFMLRFSTGFGRIPEMKHFSDEVMTWGEMNAVARARWLRNMVRAAGGNPDIIHQAFRIAQGMADTKVFPDATTSKLADQMTDYFSTMLGSSGMDDLVQGATVATKSQIVMADVNKHLKAVGSNFEFTNKKAVKDQFLGVTHDFSATGDGWINSWKLADPKGAKQDPVSFLYDLDLAIERTVKEYTLIDEFGRSFGFRRGEAGFDPKLHTARLKSDRLPHDVYFTPEHRDMMQRLMNDIEDGLWKPNSKIIQHYSRGLRIWKTGVTIYTPSHHVRNLIGDLHMMWWAGHSDPRNFIKAAKIMHSQKSKYEAAMKMDTLDGLKGLFDKDAAEWAKTTGGTAIIKQNGITLTADQIYIAAHQHGLLLDANKYEDIYGQAPLENVPFTGKLSQGMQKRIAEPFGGKAHHVAAKVLAENREHYVRIAHYVGAVNKGLQKSKDLEKVLAQAAQEVRKWHPDGRDLTNFEQKARLAIPFYSWTRKAIPLVVQTAVQRPSKVLYYPRAQMAMSELFAGNEDATHLDPFPDDQLFPEWIRAKGIGPAFDPQSSNPFSAWFGKFGNNAVGLDGEERGYVMANPSNPFNDVLESLTGFGGSPLEVGKSMFDSSTPALKIPGEIAFDQTFSGAPISDDKPGGKGIANYLFNQIPIVSMGNNVAGFEFGDQEKPAGREQGMDKQAFINYLTALGIRGTGPYTKSAEFEAKERAMKNG